MACMWYELRPAVKSIPEWGVALWSTDQNKRIE